MKIRLSGKTVIILTLILLFSVGVKAAQQDVRITVNPINEISISKNTIELFIDTISSGTESVSVTDDSSTMSYTTNGMNKKITASLTGPYDSGISLKVKVDSNSGTSEDFVELSETAVDVITNLSHAADQNQQITYKASATVDARPNTELEGQMQTVTYTITDQA